MKRSQLFAVSQFVTDYPDWMSYDDLIDAIYTGKDHDVIYWEMVENWPLNDIAEAIEMCELSFSRAVADILNEQKNPVPHDALNANFGDVMHQVNSLSVFAK
jgi:hypothetical protein